MRSFRPCSSLWRQLLTIMPTTITSLVVAFLLQLLQVADVSATWKRLIDGICHDGECVCKVRDVHPQLPAVGAVRAPGCADNNVLLHCVAGKGTDARLASRCCRNPWRVAPRDSALHSRAQPSSLSNNNKQRLQLGRAVVHGDAAPLNDATAQHCGVGTGQRGEVATRGRRGRRRRRRGARAIRCCQHVHH